MTDYSDGNWHDWTGGELPVHPKSKVQAVYRVHNGVSGIWRHRSAGDFLSACWLHITDDGEYDITAFRVTDVHREPRRWLLSHRPEETRVYADRGIAAFLASDIDGELIEVVEVLK